MIKEKEVPIGEKTPPKMWVEIMTTEIPGEGWVSLKEGHPDDPKREILLTTDEAQKLSDQIQKEL
jgi:hypothetical protein